MKKILITIVILILSISMFKYLIGFLLYSFLVFLDHIEIIFITMIASGIIQMIYLYKKMKDINQIEVIDAEIIKPPTKEALYVKDNS